MTYSGGSDTTSDVSIETEYNVTEVSNISENTTRTEVTSYNADAAGTEDDYRLVNSYLGEIESTNYNVSVDSRSADPEIIAGGYNPLITGAVDFYECQLGYGSADLSEIQEIINAASIFGVSKYDSNRVNIDNEGDPIPQFGHPCVNLPVQGGWDYVDYTTFGNFQGDLGDNVIQINTTDFGPPLRRANFDYSNGRTYKGVASHGQIPGSKEVDFNFILPDGSNVINDIDEDTIWQSGPRVAPSDNTKNKLVSHPVGGAGSPLTPGVATDPNSYSSGPDGTYEWYSSINAEQGYNTETRYDWMPVRQLLYVNHERTDDSDTTPDFGVMGVSGWLYGLQTTLSEDVKQVMSGYSPTYNHGASAINYVYGVYKKDKSDEELSEFRDELDDYIKYIQDIVEDITNESNETNQYNAKFANEPYSEYRLKPRYLNRFIESGLLERQRKNILKDNENTQMILQITFEYICSTLPINEGKKPHEYEYPFTSDRLAQQLAADGEMSMETVLDYLFAVFNNIPDKVITELGFIPKLSDIANFVHHEIKPSDPIYFRYYLYNFILWACRPNSKSKVDRFTIEGASSSVGNTIVLPCPTIWFEDGSYITLDEWINYETGGFEALCGRLDGTIDPIIITLPDGSKGYREVNCVENNPEVNDEFAWDSPKVYMTKTEPSFMAIDGPIAKLEVGEDLEGYDITRTEGVFYDMLKFRKKVLLGIYKSWSNTDIDNLSYSIPSEFADESDTRRIPLRQSLTNIDSRFVGDNTPQVQFEWADPEVSHTYTQWIDQELICFYQDGPAAVPNWAYHDNNAVIWGTHEFRPWKNGNKNPPNNQEMVTQYVWINRNDRIDDKTGELRQKPHFCFWFGPDKYSLGGWEMGPATIKLQSVDLKNPNRPAKTYRVEVPSGRKAGRQNRFMRIGAFYPKSPTNVTNDPKVMGERDEWKWGIPFKFEIRPAVKNETDVGKDPNKGPVYHASRNDDDNYAVRDQPLWYDEYWKNPRNYVKDGQKALNQNLWYEIVWNSSYAKEKVKPDLRFWWGRDKDSATPIEVEQERRKGLFMSSAQYYMSNDDEPYIFKPSTKYLYFGGINSGRTMDQWSKDGEPWTLLRRREKPPRTGPVYYGESNNGDFDFDEVHWQEEMNVVDSENLNKFVYVIDQQYLNYWEYDPAGPDRPNLPIKVPITKVWTKSARVWRFKKSVPVSMRHSHRFQWLTNALMRIPKISDKRRIDKYNPKIGIANNTDDEMGNRVGMVHTYAPVIPYNVEDDQIQGVKIYDESHFIQFGAYETKPDYIDGGKTKEPRTLKNWSRLGEPEQLTSVPLLQETGSFYWALDTNNSIQMSEADPARMSEVLNYTTASTHIYAGPDHGKGCINPYHMHWPGPEGVEILGNLDRFNSIKAAYNHKFDPDKPEGPDNKKELPIASGSHYKIKFATEEEAKKILDQVWKQQHEFARQLTPAGTSSLPHTSADELENLKYNFPLGMKFRANWIRASWAVHPDYWTDEKWGSEAYQRLIPNNCAWTDKLMEPGGEYTIKAEGDALVFGVADYDSWRTNFGSFGSKLFKDQETYSSTRYAYTNAHNDLTMWMWSPYGLHYPFHISTAEVEQGPEYYAKKDSIIIPEIENFTTTYEGEINFARKDKETDNLKGDYWNMPMSYWTPGKNDHDFHDSAYKDGKAKATKIKPHRMYKVSWVKQGVNMHPWDCNFVFVDDKIKKDNTALIKRFHYARGEGGFDETCILDSAFKSPQTYYFPDKGGYCKDTNGEIITLEKASVAGHVLLLSTSENLIMASHNPAAAGAAETPFKNEADWQKKGEQTHVKIEETTTDYWKDGWAYWASAGPDEQGRANFFSRHWNLPLKHISPGFIVEGDEYEVVALNTMKPGIVYHLWWASAGVENHFEDMDPMLADMLKNGLIHDSQTLIAGTTIRVKAKGDRLLLAATNTGVIKEELWSPDAEGAPLKIRRLPVDRDPIGPGYYGTKTESNNGNYPFKNPHWVDIWDWNSWSTFQPEALATKLTRFKAGRTYRIKRRFGDFTNYPDAPPQSPTFQAYDYEVLGALDANALTAGTQNSNRFKLYGKIASGWEYLDIKGLTNPEIVFSTINTPVHRSLTDWGKEGEEVYIDIEDFGIKDVDYIVGPGYYGQKNGAQYAKPDFTNTHFLSPLNGEKVDENTPYKIRRTQKDPNKFLGTVLVFGVSADNLYTQHGRNGVFEDYLVTLESKTTNDPPEWQYFITSDKSHIVYGVYNRAEKLTLADWSIDGEKVDVELEKVDVTSEEGPLYWANYLPNDPLRDKVDWVSKHWINPINVLKKVTIKKVGGEIVNNTQFEVNKTYIIKQKTITDYDIIFYEANTGFGYPTYPSSNDDYVEVGRLKAGIGDNTYARITPRRPELFLGAANISVTDFRSRDHRFWSKRGVPVDLIFEEVNYLEGPGYWADHPQSNANSAKGGPWFSDVKQEGNIPSQYRVQCPILSRDYWFDPINTFEGIASDQLYEVKPFGVAKWPFTITFWQANNRSDTNPRDAKQSQWVKISETRKKGTNMPLVMKPTSRFIIAGCQETDVALREEDWSPKGMPIEVQFTRIIEQEGASFFGTTNTALKRGQTAFTNPHWKGFTFLGTSTGAPLIPSVNYKVSLSKNSRNAKYRHSIYSRFSTNTSVPMTSTESGATTYAGGEIAKGTYNAKYKTCEIKGTTGAYMILSTHDFSGGATPDLRTITNWSPKGEFVEIKVLALDSNLVPDHGLIGKILGALSALASALALLLLLIKYTPPTDWLLEFDIDGPMNEVFPSRIPCEDPDNPGELPDDNKTWHGFRWTKYDAVKDRLPPHSFFWTAEPKWMNLYANPKSALIARIYGLRHHGYFFDTTNYVALNKGEKVSGLGFCNLTQTFGFGPIRNFNRRVKRISLADQKGQKSKFTSWGKWGHAKSSSGKSLDTTSGLSSSEIQERNEHIKNVNSGFQDPTDYSQVLDYKEVWHKNSRRAHWVTTVNPQFFQERQTWSNPNTTKASGYFAWPRTLHTASPTIYKRLGINERDRWFRPAMCRSVDCHTEKTVAIATMNGYRNTTREVLGDTKALITMKMGENRDKTPSQGASKDYKSMVGSVRSYDQLKWFGSGHPYTSEYGSGNSQFMDGIFIDKGFTCYIYDYWKTTKTSHNHAWIMCMEEVDTWPTNEDTVVEDEFYIGMKFDLDMAVGDTGGNPLQMVFMGINFTTTEDRFQYLELYPTKKTDYLFRSSGEPYSVRELRNQTPTKREVEVWSTKKIKYNSIISKLYWGVYIYDDGSGKPHYFGHTISNLKPLSSTFDPRGNLIVSHDDWKKWKEEQAEQEQQQS